MRDLTGAALRTLRERLAGAEAALPFAEAAASQLAHPPGVRGTPEAERQAVQRVLGVLLRGREADEPAGAAVRGLREDPELLAAVFQNIDLLYDHRHPGADGVSLLVMRALEPADASH